MDLQKKTDREELLKLFDSGNYHRLAIQVVRAWVESDYPKARFATAVVDFGDDIPPARLVVIPSASS
jgi:hypothetical protein